MDQRTSERPIIVIISGLPGTGKSGVAQRLAHDTSRLLIEKDPVKEIIANVAVDQRFELTKEFAHVAGAASMQLVYDLLDRVTVARIPAIVEAAFWPELAANDLAPYLSRTDLRQVHCWTRPNVLLERYAQRERHPVHHDDDAINGLRQRIEEGRDGRIPLDAPCFSVETTDGFHPEWDEVLAFAR